MSVLIVGVFGIILWIVTNLHLVRTGRAIKADIDEKREATEKFVQAELGTLRTDLGGTDLKAELASLRTDFKEELAGLESRLETVKIDPAPLMAQVQAELIPAVQERVEHVKSAIQGMLGYGKKSLKAAAEGVVEVVGERAVQEAGFEAEWQARLARYGIDDEWKKTHKTAALGFDLIMEALGRGQNVEIVSGVPEGTKKIGPPRGFG